MIQNPKKGRNFRLQIYKIYIMEESHIQAEIARLKSLLTGNIFEDGETQQAIYDLKKQLNPAIEFQPQLDEDDDCLYCGS